MKAVIVIDMPNDMEIKDTKALHITLFNGLFTRDISINCPLRPLPNRWIPQVNGLSIEQQIRNIDFAGGWNSCLEKIAGETE